MTIPGSIVTRSLSPLPPRTTIWVGGEVNVLDPEPAAFEHAKARAVEQAGHEVRHAIEPLKHGADLIAGEDDGEAFGALGAHDAVEPRQVDLQHVAVQEQEGAQRLVLGRGRDAAIHGQRG